MENKGKTGLSVLMGLFMLSLWSSCTTEDQLHSQTTADVETTFRLKSTAAMNGKITIREVYLKLDRVQATGNLGETNNTDVTQPIPPGEPPFQLSKPDSSKIDLTLPFRIHDDLDFHLFLFRDTYDLILEENPVAETPDPGEDHEGGSPDGSAQGEDGGDSGNDEDDHDDSDSSEGDDEHSEDDDDDEDKDEDDEEDEDDEGDEDDKNDKKKDNEKKNKKNKNRDRDKGNDEDDDEEDEDDGRTGNTGRQIADLTHFFQNAKPGMVVMGTCENNGRIINIVFVAAGVEQITIPARQNGSFSIALKEKNSAAITFNPEVWFDGLTPADIESAQIQNYQQQEVLFIHPDFNSNLFQVLAPRLEQSAHLNFDVDNLK